MSHTVTALRRVGSAVLVSLVTLLLLGVAALPSQAALDDPPVFPHNLVVFPERDFMVIEDGPANERMDIRVLRSGIEIGTATGTTDATGFLEVNHPGGVCWQGSTPNIIPFDVVEVIFADQGLDAGGEPFGMRTTTRNVVVTQPAFINGDGDVQMNGTAADAAGNPLPLDEVEARIINPDLVNTEVARRDLRAPGRGTFSYDAPGSTAWTAIWTGLSPAAQDAAVAGQSRILSFSTDPASLERVGITIYEFGEPGGPGMPECPAASNYAVTSANPASLNAGNIGGDLVISGVSHNATAVSVSLDDEDAATAALTATATPAPATGSQTWSVTFAGADVAGFGDGTLTAVGRYTVTDAAGQPAEIGGVNKSILKDTVVPEPPTATPPGGTYRSTQAVTLEAEAGARIRYTLNGSTPTATNGILYGGGQILITASQTLRAVAIDAAGNVSSVAVHAYVIDGTAPTVSASPPGGTYTSAQSVTLTASEPGSIYYTTNGSAPTTASTVYTGPITISSTTTLRFMAVDAAGNQSAVVTENYTINLADTTPPVVQAPRHTIVSISTLQATNVPVRISWSASDPSGIASYTLQRSTNGGAFTNVALASPTDTSKTVNLAPGSSTYQFRVRATDAEGNVSGFVQGAAFTVTARQETHSSITYTGAWTQASLSGAYGGAVRHASAAGRRATLSFTGTTVAWASTRGPNRGKAEVWVDGVQQATVDLYNASQQTRRVVFSMDLPAGTHSLEVRVLGQKRAASSGTRVDIDAFVVLG